MKNNLKMKLLLGIPFIVTLIFFVLIYLISYFPQLITITVNLLGNSVDKNSIISVSNVTFISLFLSMVSIAVSIILTYVVYISSKNKTNNEFNNLRETAFIQTLYSLEMIFRNKLTSIQSVDKYIEDSYRFKPILNDQEQQLLLKIWESILSIKNLDGGLVEEKVKELNHMIVHPIVNLLEKEYPQLLTHANDVTTLLNKQTISILNKLNTQKEESIKYSSRIYENGSTFLSLEDKKNVEMITVFNIDGKPIYIGTLNENTKFSGYGKITSPISREASLKKYVRSFYIGQLKDGVPHGSGIEYAKREFVEVKQEKSAIEEDIDLVKNDLLLKEGMWENGLFIDGNLFNVRMIDNLKPEIPIAHAIQDERISNINDSASSDLRYVIIGELTLHNQNYTIKKISSVSEIDYGKSMQRAIMAINKSISNINI